MGLAPEPKEVEMDLLFQRVVNSWIMFARLAVANLVMVLVLSGCSEPPTVPSDATSAEVVPEEECTGPSCCPNPPCEVPGNRLVVGVLSYLNVNPQSRETCQAFLGRAIGANKRVAAMEERWLLNLVYDSLLPSRSNQLVETGGPGEGDSPGTDTAGAEPEALPDQTTSHLLLSAGTSGFNEVQGAGGCTIRASAQRASNCPDYSAMLSNARVCLGTSLGLRGYPESIVNSTMVGDGLTVQSSSRISVGEFICREHAQLLLSGVPLYGFNGETSGPFKFSCEADRCSNRNVFLRKDPCHPAAAGIGFEEIEFRHYENIINAFQGSGGPQIVLTTRELNLASALPHRWRKAAVPWGEQVWIAFNSGKIADPPFRQRFLREVVRPAVTQSMHTVFGGEGPANIAESLTNASWLPKAADPEGKVLQDCAVADTGTNDQSGSAQPVPSTLSIGLVRMSVTQDATMKKLKEQLTSLAAERLNIKVSVRTVDSVGRVAQEDFDVIFFATPFSSDTTDNAPTLARAMTFIDRAWGGLAGTDSQVMAVVRGLLPTYSRLLLLTSRLHERTRQVACEIEKRLQRTSVLYPVFVKPIYVYYDSSRLKGTPQANFISGFINLQEWMK